MLDMETSLPPPIRQALALMGSRYFEPLSVEQVAEVVGLSRTYFSRLFRQRIGKSPYQHLIEVRLDYARALLESGRHGVIEVAGHTGFTDLSQFARQFRRRYGCAPSEVCGKKARHRAA